MSSSSSSDISTTYASDANSESNASLDSNGNKSSGSTPSRKSQRLSGVNDSGFVTREVNNSDTDITSSTSTPDSGSNLTANLSATSSDSSSTKRARKNATPKRRLNAIEEIAHFQKTTRLLIPQAAFKRVVREIVEDIGPDYLIQKQALEALQESAEMYLVQLFEDARLLTEHRRCVTVDAKDMKLARKIQTPGFRSQSDGSGSAAVQSAKSAKKTNATGSPEENDESE